MEFLSYSEIRNYAQEIINNSIYFHFGRKNEGNQTINEKLKKYENEVFYLSENTNILLDNNIDYVDFITSVDETSPINLKWLKSLNNPELNEPEHTFKFPVKQVLIVEGITEETLLPVFAKTCGTDFDKIGIQIVSAGGKNQVVKSFYTFSEQLKVPIFVLLDSDAKENYEQIKLKLRQFDRIYILNGGEFEDILPKTLIKRTLNDHFINLNSIDDSDFTNERMVINLEEIFKNKGFHEFKKAEFAQLIKNHIKSTDDISDEIKLIIDKISADRFSSLQ